MNSRLLVATCALLLGSCSVLQRPTPQQKLAVLVDRYPELARANTVRDTVKVFIPQVEFRKGFTPAPNPTRELADQAVVDSLLWHVETTLDSAQYAYLGSGIHRLMKQRPVLYDTLCFDTLGVQGRVWRDGQSYQLWLQRKEITATQPVQIVATKLAPCPPAPAYLFYDPRGWPWWLLLASGFAAGVALSYGLFRAALTTAR